MPPMSLSEDETGVKLIIKLIIIIIYYQICFFNWNSVTFQFVVFWCILEVLKTVYP